MLNSLATKELQMKQKLLPLSIYEIDKNIRMFEIHKPYQMWMRMKGVTTYYLEGNLGVYSKFEISLILQSAKSTIHKT